MKKEKKQDVGFCKEKVQGEPLFSGGNSEGMWEKINTARTKKKLRLALYEVCCNLQRLEYRLSHESK